MSAIIGAVVGAVILGVLVPAGTKLVRRAVSEISSRFDVDDLNQASVTFAQTGETIKPISKIRSEFKPFQADSCLESNVEKVKSNALASLAEAPLYTSNEKDLKQRIAALKRARTLEEVRAASRELSFFVQHDHQKVFAESIRAAGERASNKLGFTKFEAIPNSISGGQIRFAATDVLGRTLVTEINAPVDGDVSIDTEVVGVSDDSCHKILDEFYEALRSEGVDILPPPKRSSTGGICTSAAAKIFLSSRMPVKRKRAASGPVGRKAVRSKRNNRSAKRIQRDIKNRAS